MSTYNYIGLVNDVLEEFNEVTLTAVDFTSVIGFHSLVKNRINTAIADIYAEEDDAWPFTKTTATQILTVGFTGGIGGVIPSYTLSGAVSNVDWTSFFIKRNDALADPNAKRLTLISWDNYRDKHRDSDANISVTGPFTKPDFIARLPNNNWVVSPPADLAYTVNFECSSTPVLLSAATDVPIIPEMYRQVIVDKAIYYAYMFRDNAEEATLANDRYTSGVNRMRRALIPQADTLRFLD